MPFKNIYPKDLHLKAEYQENLASFLDLDIKKEDVIELFSYTNCLKKEKKSPFVIVQMPILSHNMPFTICNSKMYSKN